MNAQLLLRALLAVVPMRFRSRMLTVAVWLQLGRARRLFVWDLRRHMRRLGWDLLFLVTSMIRLMMNG